jgi:hypothetical protein
MTKAQVQTLIEAAGDTQSVVRAEQAMRAYLQEHPGSILKAGEHLYRMKAALHNLGEWDEAAEQAVRDAACPPAMAKSA